MEDAQEDINRLEELCRKINDLKCDKAVFRLPLMNDSDYYDLLTLAESYEGYRAVKAADGEYIFELSRKSAIRYLKTCITGIRLIPNHPIKQIKLEKIIECTDDTNHASGSGTKDRSDDLKKAPLPDINGDTVYCMTRKPTSKPS